MKKVLAALIAVLVSAAGFSAALPGVFDTEVFAAAAPPEIIGEAGILIDGTTGKILYTKNEHEKLEPASTTKMITCLLALENLKLDQVMTIDAETPYTEGSRIYLEEGEQITVENVLYGLMLESANDCAVALAKEIAGSVDEFAVMMNKRARELGAEDCNFLNPNGLHMDGHLASVYDLAMIAKGCMTNETFRTLCSTYYHYVPATNEQDERHLYNTNRLLYDQKTKVPVNGVNIPAKYEGAIGIKTGYTSHAGGCLVAGAKRGDTFLIAAVLKSTDEGRFGDCIALLDYGFASYHTVQAVDGTQELDAVSVKRGGVGTVDVALAGDAYVTLPLEASSSVLQQNLKMNKEIRAPIKKGDQLGVMEVYEGEELVASVAVLAGQDVEKGTLLSIVGIGNKTAHIIYATVGAIILLIVIFAAAIIVLKRRQAKRRREQRAKRAMQIAKERAERERDVNRRDWHF